MTQEQKQLLLVDLSARLPYNVKVDITYNKEHGSSYRLRMCGEGCLILNTDVLGLYIEDEIYLKPYLRTMSSMTEEEKKELKADTCPEGTGYFDEKYLICPMSHYGEQISYDFMSVILEWLNSRHFDYRGLIEKDLALEASEDMYK